MPQTTGAYMGRHSGVLLGPGPWAPDTHFPLGLLPVGAYMGRHSGALLGPGPWAPNTHRPLGRPSARAPNTHRLLALGSTPGPHGLHISTSNGITMHYISLLLTRGESDSEVTAIALSAKVSRVMSGMGCYTSGMARCQAWHI